MKRIGMMLQIVLLVFFLSSCAMHGKKGSRTIASTNEAATTHCHNAGECLTLIEGATADLKSILNIVAVPRLTEILKKGVNHDEAKKICQDKGMRLPTARELALVAQSLGAEGISETEKDGYKFIKGSDSAGNPDHFYFSKKGYKEPEGELGKHFFWSSSVHPDVSYNAYGLDGYDGDVDYYDRSDVRYAVRCVRSR